MNKSNNKKPVVTIKLFGAKASGKTCVMERIEAALILGGYALKKRNTLNQTMLMESEYNIVKIIENQ